MSSGVCQGLLQNCLPRSDLREPKQQTLVENGELEGHKKSELGCWDLIQALNNNSYTHQEAFDNEKAYVHPLMKRSTSIILDQKSLEMCTESLGSETGSYTNKSEDEFPLLSLKSWEKFTDGDASEEPEIRVTKKMNCSRSFPPPLSSISSLDCVQVSPSRVGGRLVIKVVSVSTCHAYFHAERGDGRLRLRFLNHCSQNFDNKDEVEDEDEDGEALEEVEEEEEEEYYEDRNEDDSDYCLYESEDIEGKSGNVGVEIGIEKLQRPTRCMEGGEYGGNSLFNCETLWIAT